VANALNTQTPVEIDTQIAHLLGEAAKHFDTAQNALRKHDRLREILHSGDAYAKQAAGGEAAIRMRIAELKDIAETEQAQGRDYESEIVPLNQEWRNRGQWTRVYLVDNSNGHVHTSTACRNTYASTQFIWITRLSGASEGEVIEQAGSRTCLTCFPSVREEIIAGRPCMIESPARRASRLEREARIVARAEKMRKTGITNPDGTPLVINDLGKREIKTEVAANRAAMQAAYDIRLYSTTDPYAPEWAENMERCLAALAHKRGTTVAIEREALIKKVEAKYRREMQ
jgi:hypothetical protein